MTEQVTLSSEPLPDEADPLDASEIPGIKTEDEVTVDVSFHIVAQYGRHLYTNPRKAIEELACNSYDACATECYIRRPGDSGDPLIILDNGESMDHDGLTRLWTIADSPKHDDDTYRKLKGRSQIGKFGVGKLASFALGTRLTHIVHKDGETRQITVDLHGLGEASASERPGFPVYVIPENQVAAHLEGLLGDVPKPWNKAWESWTIAIVDGIDSAHIPELHHAFAERMISTALPLHSKFKVFLDDVEVKRQTIDSSKEIILEHGVQDADVVAAIENRLKIHHADRFEDPKGEKVDERLYKVRKIELDAPWDDQEKVPGLEVPGVGPVAGNLVATLETLTANKRKERGYYDHGFFVRVHDKLVNPEDNTFGYQTPLSYQAFNRMAVHLEVPELDPDLLVQRNMVSEQGTRPALVREICAAMFNIARKVVKTRLDSTSTPTHSLFQRMYKQSPAAFSSALAGLEIGHEGFDASKMEVTLSGLSDDGPLSLLDPENSRIVVNDEHPFLRTLNLTDPGKQRAVGELIAAGEMVAGLLRTSGVDPVVIDDTRDLLDAVAKASVEHIEDQLEYHRKVLLEAAQKGGADLEVAARDALIALGIGASHNGGSSKSDGVVEIRMPGMKNPLISIEAKGGNQKVDHKEASVETLRDHAKEDGAEHILLVARDDRLVVGKADDEESWTTLTKQSRDSDPPIVIFPVERLIQLLELHHERFFTRQQLHELLTEWIHPGFLEVRIQALWEGADIPEDEPEIRRVLETLDEQTSQLGPDRPNVSNLQTALRFNDVEWDVDKVWRVITGLHQFAMRSIGINEASRECWMKVEPDLALKELEENLGKVTESGQQLYRQGCQ